LQRLLIWGASGHARVVADIIRLNNQYELAGFIDDTASAPERFFDLPVYHDLQAVGIVPDKKLIVAVGDCGARMRIAASALQRGFTLLSAIHPHATVSTDSFIGAGT